MHAAAVEHEDERILFRLAAAVDGFRRVHIVFQLADIAVLCFKRLNCFRDTDLVPVIIRRAERDLIVHKHDARVADGLPAHGDELRREAVFGIDIASAEDIAPRVPFWHVVGRTVRVQILLGERSGRAFCKDVVAEASGMEFALFADAMGVIRAVEVVVTGVACERLHHGVVGLGPLGTVRRADEQNGAALLIGNRAEAERVECGVCAFHREALIRKDIQKRGVIAAEVEVGGRVAIERVCQLAGCDGLLHHGGRRVSCKADPGEQGAQHYTGQHGRQKLWDSFHVWSSFLFSFVRFAQNNCAKRC